MLFLEMSWIYIIGIIWLCVVVISMPLMVWAFLTAPIAEEDEERGFVIIQPAPSLRERFRSKDSRPALDDSFAQSATQER